ncbi:MAG TPA: hypothetical protein VI316_08825, partial [Candidatus Dormibacteraeota bacterium]
MAAATARHRSILHGHAERRWPAHPDVAAAAWFSTSEIHPTASAAPATDPSDVLIGQRAQNLQP